MQFEEEDVLDIPLLEHMDDLPIASLTHEEEALLLSEYLEAQATATCPLRHREWAPEPESAARLGEAATEPQGMWRCQQPPGFESLPLEQDIPLIWVPDPDEAQSLLTPVSTMGTVVYKNEVMGDLKYEYMTQFLKLLHSESPDHRPKLLCY